MQCLPSNFRIFTHSTMFVSQQPSSMSESGHLPLLGVGQVPCSILLSVPGTVPDKIRTRRQYWMWGSCLWQNSRCLLPQKMGASTSEPELRAKEGSECCQLGEVQEWCVCARACMQQREIHSFIHSFIHSEPREGMCFSG